ncbi:uncharacterized protein COLE_04848 [Cutaneotrichosporon oleaginosum]|uniref:uncharacterized protein n=1 Tax=Cutaneotrichosporon oleaginosum TaxID=879819 RepID=UPI0013293BD0|nr:hypothetical protein COLE_04848 [Cutaneotrichosporon oleaginosum]
MPSPHHPKRPAGAVRRMRAAQPHSTDGSEAQSLSSLFSNLPSISGISEMAGVGALKSFLPKSPSPSVNPLPTVEAAGGAWADADLGSGRSRVLIAWAQRAVQVFALSDGVIPDDPHVPETFPAPVEIATIPSVLYASDAQFSALPGVQECRTQRNETVLNACLLHHRMWGEHGPVLAVCTHSPESRGLQGPLGVSLISLRTGRAYRRLDVGKGIAGSVTASQRAIVITTSHPSPSIYVVNQDLELVTPSIVGLPAHPQSFLPVVALSGRLLALASSEPAATPGPHGLGSIVTASMTRPRISSVSSQGSASTAAPPTAQGAILSSAVELGGGVARGVWAGLKAGAKAASQASSGRLASSAPNDRVLENLSSPTSETCESRSHEDADIASPKPLGGVWVKILDLFPASSVEPELIAHFRLPSLRHLVAAMPTQSPRSTIPRDQPVVLLNFSPDGTRLFAAPADGRAFHVLEVRPRGAMLSRPGPPKGEVWDTYVLRRGNTTASVRSVSWSPDGRYVAVGTGRGTVHVFPVCPGGGKPTAASHVPLKLTNAHILPALSVEIAPCARIRPYRAGVSENTQEKADAEGMTANAVAMFAALRTHPLGKGTLCQDIVIFRSAKAELDLARLAAHQVALTAASPPAEAHRRLSSNLTEMMRQKAGLRSESDLDIKSAVVARWALPIGEGGFMDMVTLPAVMDSKQMDPGAADGGRGSIHYAEIRTHSTSPRILPSSIYLSHQATFHAAIPTDEFSPLSVLDKVARTRRLVFRPEVEVHHPAPPEASSFDEPLSSALHSMMDARPSPQVPALPNGSPSKAGLWGSIPIRRAAANLGEGLDVVRREYARAQHKRSRRRSAASGTPLSFEDDTVFATIEDDASSAPSSGPLPATDGGSTDAEWGDRWEDEYRRAVEDDGGAEDLVLGLLDEEEDERRRWERQQKVREKEQGKP